MKTKTMVEQNQARIMEMELQLDRIAATNINSMNQRGDGVSMCPKWMTYTRSKLPVLSAKRLWNNNH